MSGHRETWEDLAVLDPCWAVLSAPGTQHGGWDTDAFFATGETEIAEALAHAAELGWPTTGSRALDFGCGLGRLTRALAGRYETVVGVDISEAMLAQAREMNAVVTGVEWLHNTRNDLRDLPSGSFDLVYSNVVLQHMPSADVMASFVGEFVRVLAPGGMAIFQAPSQIDIRRRIQPRRRAYTVLRRFGVARETLYGRMRLMPMRMTALPVERVRAAVAAAGGRLVEERPHGIGFPGIESKTYYATTVGR